MPMLVELLPQEAAVALDVPDDFHAVPLDGRTEVRTAAQLEIVADLGLPSADQREALSLYLEALARRVAGSPVRGAAFCAVRLGGQPSTASLTVAVHPTGSGDPGLVALGAAETLRRAGRYDSVQVLELGLVPAVSAVVERAAVPAESPTGRAGETLREMSVLVPVTGRPLAVLVTLCTPCLDDWDTYVRVLLQVARSVRVERSSSRIDATSTL